VGYVPKKEKQIGYRRYPVSNGGFRLATLRCL